MTRSTNLTSKNEISGLICYVDTDSGLDFPHISLMSRASLIEPLCTTRTMYYINLQQVVATLFVSLWHLNDGACVSISSTILYSLERGSEGIRMSLDEATLVRKF